MDLKLLEEKLNHLQYRFIGEETAFRSAVLIPLVKIDKDWHILFELRSMTMRKQPGDISFPGGTIDQADSSPLEAALRETYEELGIHPNSVKVLGELSPLITSTSFVIYPFVGVVDFNQIKPNYNKEEVEEVFTVPIDWLLNYEPYSHLVKVQMVPEENFPYEKISNGKKYQWRMREVVEWFYDYNEYTIWGLTAKILKHFIEILKR